MRLTMIVTNLGGLQIGLFIAGTGMGKCPAKRGADRHWGH